MAISCFECGSEENIHMHHVVPKSLGGTKTIPLCAYCHGKVHSINLIEARVLQKKKLKEAWDNGKRWGRTPYGYKLERGAWVVCEEEIKTLQWIKERHDAGMTFRQISTALEEMGIYTQYGHPWHSSSLARVLKRKNFPFID